RAKTDLRIRRVQSGREHVALAVDEIGDRGIVGPAFARDRAAEDPRMAIRHRTLAPFTQNETLPIRLAEEFYNHADVRAASHEVVPYPVPGRSVPAGSLIPRRTGRRTLRRRGALRFL